MLRNFVITIVVLFLFVLSGFILWMNFTPGHYQPSHCGCSAVSYIQDRYVRGCTLEIFFCETKGPIDNLLTILAKLDFNR